jgi:hypothetical protein
MDENLGSTTRAKRREKGHPEGGRPAMPRSGTNPGQAATRRALAGLLVACGRHERNKEIGEKQIDDASSGPEPF